MVRPSDRRVLYGTGNVRARQTQRSRQSLHCRRGLNDERCISAFGRPASSWSFFLLFSFLFVDGAQPEGSISEIRRDSSKRH